MINTSSSTGAGGKRTCISFRKMCSKITGPKIQHCYCYLLGLLYITIILYIYFSENEILLILSMLRPSEVQLSGQLAFFARFLEQAPPEQREQFTGLVRSLEYLRLQKHRPPKKTETVRPEIGRKRQAGHEHLEYPHGSPCWGP